MQQKFLSVADVAKMLGTSIPSIWRWSRIGEMPKPIKIGPNRTAWSAADLDAWLAAKTVAPTPTPPAAAPVAARPPRKPRPTPAAAVPVEDAAALCEEFA